MNLLLVCTGNVARSPMAESVFRELLGDDGRHVARSVGTAPDAARRLTTRDLAWAHRVAVMEAEHLAMIRRHWPDYAQKVVVLGVPDHYEPGEADLRAVLLEKIRAVIDSLDAVAKETFGESLRDRH